MDNYAALEVRIRKLENLLYEAYDNDCKSVRSLHSPARKNELFGGRIGKVNASSKDAPKVIDSIRGIFSEREMDLDVNPDGFIIHGSYTIPKKNKTFFFTIGERVKDKICIDLEILTGKGYEDIDQVKGLILNPTKIKNSLIKLMTDNDYDESNDRLKATSIVQKAAYERERARKEREEAEQMERDLQDLKRKEKEKEKEREQSSKKKSGYYNSRDWVGSTPSPKTWTLDPGRL